MDRNKETLATWNKVASLYQDKFMNLDLYNETYDYFCNSILKNKAQILDIGCGPGNITKYLLSKRPDLIIHGIDNATSMIELAKKNNPKASFSVMDCRHLTQLKSKYDGIICGFCLPYLSGKECEKLFSDSKELLNDGGKIYISFVEGNADKSDFQTSSIGNRVYFYYHELNVIKSQLDKIGLKELKLFKIKYEKSDTKSESHTILIAQK